VKKSPEARKGSMPFWAEGEESSGEALSRGVIQSLYRISELILDTCDIRYAENTWGSGSFSSLRN